jgi:subtilisin family serine protease
MTPARTRIQRGAALAAAAAALGVVCLPAQSASAYSDPAAGGLSPRLAEISKPSFRAAPPVVQARRLGVAAAGPASLSEVGNRIVVDVRFERGAAAGADDVRAAGVQVLNVSSRYQTITAAARPSQLRDLASLSRVASVGEVLAPVMRGCAGSVTSEGDLQLDAAIARSDFGVDGSGVTVGILSDSFDTSGEVATSATEDVKSGDIPGSGNPCGHTTPVDVLENPSPSFEVGDEGRAMAQIVHDLAPGANLAFATAFFEDDPFDPQVGQFLFAENIERLARPVAQGGAGAEVIVDDVGYFEEPFFQDGPVATAIDKVVSEGVSYFSAVGNDNLIEEPSKNEISSWETPVFRDSAGCPPELEAISHNPDHCLDFDPEDPGEDETFGITVSPKRTLIVAVQWAEPWFGVESDLDAYLLDSSDKVLAASGGNSDNISGQVPAEVLAWKNEVATAKEVHLAINRCFGAICNQDASSTKKPRVKLILLQNGSGVTATEHPETSGEDVVGPSVFGHAGAPAAISVGAVRYNTVSSPERYSSRGPVTHYFGRVTGTTAAAALVPEEVISKPDVAATDCGRTTFFVPVESEPGIFRFCGTSAAAPHAAAIAALALQANPGLTPAQVRSALATTARPVGAFGPNAVGSGLVDAHGVLADVALPPVITIVNPPRPLSNNRSPSIGFTANRPVSFACSFDGAEPLPCTSPFTPLDPLTDGVHGFAVRGEDLAGKVGVSETVSFTVDTVPPRTFFSIRPRKTLRTRTRKAKAVFGFASSEPGSTFTCRVDGGLVRFCPPRFVKRFREGRHVLRAMAVDTAGNVDRTPATFRFKVKQVGRASRSR